MTKVTTLEFSDNGAIGVTLTKTVTGRTGVAQSTGFHRAFIYPGDDPVAVKMLLDFDLESRLGVDAIDDGSWDVVKLSAGAMHNPEVIIAFSNEWKKQMDTAYSPKTVDVVRSIIGQAKEG